MEYKNVFYYKVSTWTQRDIQNLLEPKCSNKGNDFQPKKKKKKQLVNDFDLVDLNELRHRLCM